MKRLVEIHVKWELLRANSKGILCNVLACNYTLLCPNIDCIYYVRVTVHRNEFLYNKTN